MNPIIKSSIDSLIKYYDNEINELIKEREAMIKNHNRADEVLLVLKTKFKKLKFSEFEKISVCRNGKIVLNVLPDDSFKFYIFKGYKRDGSLVNENSMVTKANKIGSNIENILKEFNASVYVNQFSLELKKADEKKSILIEINFKD